MTIEQEIARRRVFAIISHPDAGKTTLTEKLLLYGGAIRLAGSVKARKAERHATSDWMEIEKQRGISVTSSVMQFDFDGYRVNILDTPGHQDFSEDTYRTLVAADSAVMIIDGSRGVEAQTVKLFRVCRQRGIPIFTFVNKMDRQAKDPFELMDEIESVLGIRLCPITWPIGTQGDFQGVYHRDQRAVELFSGGDHGQRMADSSLMPLEGGGVESALEAHYLDRLRDEVELLEGAGDAFDPKRVLNGELSPMFFGSAMNNFGVKTFLEHFLTMSAPPAPRHADIGIVEPEHPDFSGFIFKIQANMNPAHRDRIAFMRVCSGVFNKGMAVTNAGTGQKLKLAQPQAFMAQERTAVEDAYPGDIIGLFDPGVFRLGDTLYTGKPFRYEGIPLFAPELFCRLSPMDSLKRKQFSKGVEQLSEEGAIQTFRESTVGREEWVVGVVGVLQFDVLAHRLRFEYNVEVRMERLDFTAVRWIISDIDEPERLKLTSTTRVARDTAARPVLLFENDWSLRWALENNKGLELADMVPRKG